MQTSKDMTRTLPTYTCAIYTRVSTEKDSQSESPENQIDTCRMVARNKSKEFKEAWLTPDDLIYTDKGSGTNFLHRSEILKLLKDAEEGKFQIVLFKGISRFARDTEDALHMLRRLLATKVRVISHAEGYDSKTGSEFVFTIHASFAQQVSEKISIDVTLGNKARANNGKWNGIAPDGYVIDQQTKKLIINPDRAHIIQYIFDMFTKENIGTTHITKRLNEEGFLTRNGKKFDRKRVYTILRNRTYIGDVEWGQRRKEVYYDSSNQRRKRTVFDPDKENYVLNIGAHPAIIEQAQFVQAQRLLDSNKSEGRGRKDWIYLLSGRIKCSVCGSPYGGKVNHIGTRYYRCTSKVRMGASACSNYGVRALDIEESVLSHLKHIIINKDIEDFNIVGKPKLEQEEEVTRKNIKKIQDDIQRLTHQSLALLEKNISGNISDEMFSLMNQKIEEQIKQNKSSLAVLQGKLDERQSDDEKLKTMREAAELLMSIDPEVVKNRPIIKRVISTIVESIVIHPDKKVEIHSKFM